VAKYIEMVCFCNQTISESLKKSFYSGRIIEVNLDVAGNWGRIQGELAKKGQMMPVIDSLIACTGITYSMAVVTRNITDMERKHLDSIPLCYL